MRPAAVPGSKSLTNRWLVLAALAETPTRITAPLDANDTRAMRSGIHALGARITDEVDDAGNTVWHVTPPPEVPRLGPGAPVNIDCGAAGTVLRFLPPVTAALGRAARFDGIPRLRARPMRPLLDALIEAGADIHSDTATPVPFTVHAGQPPHGGHVRVDATASSQFVSALLLSAPRFAHGIRLRHTGDGPVPSAPHIDMTLQALQRAGARAQATATGWTVAPGRLRIGAITIEPDLATALPFLAAAVVTAGTVTLPWPEGTPQASATLLHALESFGATTGLADDTLTVTGPQRVHAVDLDLSAAGELAPVITAIAAHADGTCRLRGIAHLRGHESDRLAALADMLTTVGGRCDVTPDGLVIHPAPLHAATVRTHADHRLAMAAAVLGLTTPDIRLDDVACTAKTFPAFAETWSTWIR